jgi:hypothetical protein
VQDAALDVAGEAAVGVGRVVRVGARATAADLVHSGHERVEVLVELRVILDT